MIFLCDIFFLMLMMFLYFLGVNPKCWPLIARHTYCCLLSVFVLSFIGNMEHTVA
jgi:hypothetical protein